jgi:hypothetical protein
MGRRSRRAKGEPRRKRQPRDWEEPGAVLRGPPISVTCECGEKRDLQYGTRWECERCGRAYDTATIPREQYDVIRRLSLRYRVVPVAFGMFVAATAIFFTLTGNIPGAFFLLPISMATWFVFIRPAHRRRYRAAVAALPRWTLRAE